MAVGDILKKTSFIALDADGQATVRDLLNSWELPLPKISGTEEEPAIKAIAAERRSLGMLVERYGERLDRLNSLRFAYMSDRQKKVCVEELYFTFFLLCAQFQLDKAEERWQVLKSERANIKHCAKLFSQLRESILKQSLDAQHQRVTDDSEKYLKFMGIDAARIISEQMLALIDSAPGESEAKGGITGTLISTMSEFNFRRLYWIWSGGFLSTIIAMLPDYFVQKESAQARLDAPSPVTGYISFALYYTRFFINVSLLAKHVWWPSQEESQIPVYERFLAQWEQRKFALLNDSIWATANMACFFWLNYASTRAWMGRGFGYWGDVLTAVLLLMDTSLALWRLEEENTRHRQQLLRFDDDILAADAKRQALKASIDALKEQIDQLNQSRENEASEEAHVDDKRLRALNKKLASEEENARVLAQQRAELMTLQNQYELDWKYKNYNLINDLVYAVSLLSSFIIFCCVFAGPFAPATTLMFGVVGAALCFTLTTIYTAVGSALEVEKLKETKALKQIQLRELLMQFSEADEKNVKKLLFLDIKLLQVEAEYQENTIAVQKLKILSNILVDVMVPVAIFTCFLLLPIGFGTPLGYAVLAGAFLLPAFANHFFEKMSEENNDLLGAKKEALSAHLDEDEYDEFAQKGCANLLNQLQEISTPKRAGLFALRHQEGYEIVSGDDNAEELDPKPQS